MGLNMKTRQAVTREYTTHYQKATKKEREPYYRWVRYGVSERRGKADAELTAFIREIALRHHRRYESPWVWEELRRVYGKRVSHKKVARLMRENGLNARRRRKYIPTIRSNHGFPVCENILDRQFCAGKPGKKWVSSYRRYACGPPATGCI
jgi:transposase InsO family protein